MSNTKSGFGALSEARRKEVSSKGGREAHARGTAHQFTAETASVAGRKAHANGTAYRWTREQAQAAGRKGAAMRKANKAREDGGVP